MVRLTVNDTVYELNIDPQMPLLCALRDELGLTGTKYGCGIAQCGACTVHVAGQALRSCSIPVSAVKEKPVTTIEGLSRDGSHPLQKAWKEEDVPQCGYCQAGQIMTAAALLKRNPSPTEEDVIKAMNGNLCRCGTYQRIRKAILRAAEM